MNYDLNYFLQKTRPFTYLEYMDQISPNDIYKGFLAYGLFPEKLPDFLTSKIFYEYCNNSNISFNKNWQSYITFESIKNVNMPRLMGIPTPIAYQNLCKSISANWSKIKEHFANQTNNQKYKISRIHIRKRKNSNALFSMNYNNWEIDGSPEPDLLIGSRYVVKTDISTCFPSIYTHSIPWAIAGKDNVKSNLSSKKTTWYNQLDSYSQNMKNGETHGLIIGPHSSNLLAEIILTAVDKNLYDKGWHYIRNIDDYSCYVNSYEKGEKFLIDLRSELKQFDLFINLRKTEILELPISSSCNWIRKITSFSLLIGEKPFDYKITRAFLDSAIELMHNNNMNAAILHYTIKVLSSKKLTFNANEYSIKTIFHWALIYPYLIPLLGTIVFEKFNVTKNQICEISQKIYKFGLDHNNYEAVYYSIYYAIKFNFEIHSINVQDIIETNSCISKLLAALYFKKFKNDSSFKELKKDAVVLSENDTTFCNNWLFVYEILNGQLTGEWKDLKKHKISFLKDEFKQYINL